MQDARETAQGWGFYQVGLQQVEILLISYQQTRHHRHCFWRVEQGAGATEIVARRICQQNRDKDTTKSVNKVFTYILVWVVSKTATLSAQGFPLLQKGLV